MAKQPPSPGLLDWVFQTIKFDINGKTLDEIIESHLEVTQSRQVLQLPDGSLPYMVKVAIERIVMYLLDRKLIYSNNGRYHLSVEGLLFFESTSKRYVNRPFAYEVRRQKTDRVWKVVKIIGVVANALVLIVIGYLSINSDDDRNVIVKPTIINKIILTPDSTRIKDTSSN